MSASRRLWLVWIWAVSTPALAVTVPDLFRAEVLVTGQGAQEREQGFRHAMEQVLVKLTGDPQIATRAGVAEGLRSASRHVQQYRYRALQPLLQEQRPLEDPQPAGGTPQIPVPTHVLEVEFAESSLLRVLESHGIPVWGRERPQSMAWVAVDAPGGRYLVGSETQDEVGQALRARAAERGVPVLLPLLDVEDRANVDYADLRGGFTERLLQAAGRYGVERVLVGHLSRGRDGIWRGEWIFQGDGRFDRWSARGLDADQVVLGGIDGLGQRLATLYAVNRATRTQRLHLRIEDLRELQDYAAVSRYLAGINITRSVRLTRVRSDSVEFEIEIQGGRAELERALALNNQLYPAERGLRALFADGEAASIGDPAMESLVYRFQP